MESFARICLNQDHETLRMTEWTSQTHFVPWHQKTVRNSTRKKVFLTAWKAARRAAAHHSGAAGAVTAPGHLPHPSDGCCHPQNKDIWSTLESALNHAAACLAGLRYYQQLTYNLSLRGPPLLPTLNEDNSTQNNNKTLSLHCQSHPQSVKYASAAGLWMYFPAALP